MVSTNPFSTPQTDDTYREGSEGHGGFYLQNDVLVMPKTSSLPPLCVRCGKPAEKRLAQTFYWHHPLVYLTILLSIIVYLIAAALSRKNAKLTVPLCDEHQKQRTRMTLIGVGLMLVGFASCAGAMNTSVVELAWLSAVVMPVAGVLVTSFGRRTVRIKKIDDLNVYFIGLPQSVISRALSR